MFIGLNKYGYKYLNWGIYVIISIASIATLSISA